MLSLKRKPSPFSFLRAQASFCSRWQFAWQTSPLHRPGDNVVLYRALDLANRVSFLLIYTTIF